MLESRCSFLPIGAKHLAVGWIKNHLNSPHHPEILRPPMGIRYAVASRMTPISTSVLIYITHPSRERNSLRRNQVNNLEVLVWYWS
jgi:hypothetical protein